MDWQPLSDASLFSSFPGSSPRPALSRIRETSSPSSTVQLARITDLPVEILLCVTSYLYLPPNEYSSAHERNLDLKSLGLAAPSLQVVVRSVLFEETAVTTEREVRWLLRRREMMALIR